MQNQVTNSTETGNILGEKQKNIGDFELTENNSASEISLKIKIEQEDINKLFTF